MPNIREIFLEHQSTLLTDRAAACGQISEDTKTAENCDGSFAACGVLPYKNPQRDVFSCGSVSSYGIPKDTDTRKCAQGGDIL